MNADTHEAVWLDQHITVTLDEFARLCGLTAAELGELVDEGVVEPEASVPAGALFRADSVTTIRSITRMRHDFELDLPAVALIKTFLDRINQLEAEISAMHAELPQWRRLS
jgi:hypothetical protein